MSEVKTVSKDDTSGCLLFFLVGGLGTGSLTGIGTGALGLPAVNNDPFVQRKLGTSGLNQPTFQQSKMKPCKW